MAASTNPVNVPVPATLKVPAMAMFVSNLALVTESSTSCTVLTELSLGVPMETALA